MKCTPSLVADAPSYYVDHFHSGHNTDKCVVLRDLSLESALVDDSLRRQLASPTHVLDLTNNELNVIPDLHERSDVHTLLLARNCVRSVDGKLLPSQLKHLVLAYNDIGTLESLNALKKSPRSLRTLVLRGNPVCHLDGYREYVLRLLPQLQMLDFTKIGLREKQLARNVGLRVGGPSIDAPKRDKAIGLMQHVVNKLSKEQRRELKLKLANATSLEEIAKLEKLLSGGV